MRVSTIIPTYNRAGIVPRAIESALAQTWSDHEVVVVDDGSRDDTPRAVGAYGDRVRYVRQDNAGLPAARNAGVQVATGDAFALLDDDDTWAPDKLAAQVEYLEAHPDIGMVLTEIVRFAPDGSERGRSHRREALPADGAVLPWVLRHPQMIPSTAVYRREVHDAVGGFDESLRTGEDQDFYLKVALRFGIGLIERPLTRYAVAADGRMSTAKRTHSDAMFVVERFLREHADELPAELCREARLANYARNAEYALYDGHLGLGLSLAARAVPQVRGWDDAHSLARLGRRTLGGVLRRWRRS